MSAVRFGAALAVVKYARGDLLIGTSLSLQLVRPCLVQAMRLRDRDLGTTTHRHGSDRDGEVARLDQLRRHRWTTTGGLALIEDAAAAYDRLTGELDPAYTPDWTGLRALLAQARRAAVIVGAAGASDHRSPLPGPAGAAADNRLAFSVALFLSDRVQSAKVAWSQPRDDQRMGHVHPELDFPGSPC